MLEVNDQIKLPVIAISNVLREKTLDGRRADTQQGGIVIQIDNPEDHMNSGWFMREVRTRRRAVRKPIGCPRQADQMPLFEGHDNSSGPRRKNTKSRTRKIITPEDRFWIDAESATEEEWSIVDMLEELWEAGIYDVAGGPSPEWLEKHRFRGCPFHSAIQLDLLDALREPCNVCGGEELLIDGVCSECDKFAGGAHSV